MSKRVGLWLIGAHGGVATTVAVGLSALKLNALGDATDCGLVSQLPQFEKLPLIEWENIVIGGHEIRQTDSITEAFQLAGARPAIQRELIIQCEAELKKFDENVRPGILNNVGQTIGKLATEGFALQPSDAATAIEHVENDLREFAERNQLDSLIVINVSSTEPPLDPAQFPEKWSALSDTLSGKNCALPASSLYAIAALKNNWPYVNFTPSLGSSPAAIQDLATQQNVCHYGHDGRTGETFMKSVLAPAFAKRNLNILSWVGHNIFGNMDGQVLDDPLNKQTKITSKDKLLGEILGYNPHTLVTIEYIRGMGDWKTAWDHIHFRGFLGTPMILTFTWEGCDSILAAPLVLDLFRFVDLARREGETGLLTFLACFFKSPLGTKENDFAVQFQQLTEWADQVVK